ncbi:UNVERIFIED_CONTAM: hypothetical protein GTU68_063867 [Idotea baltica]|nr:hypothetical protein [Idotea baltica]
MGLTNSKLLIISAPSGAGKTTLVNAILQRYSVFEFSISATTRKQRSYEKEGVHYYFITKEEFMSRRDAGDFLEWEEVYTDTYYGSLKSEVDRICIGGKYPIFDVDVEGGLNIKRQYGDRAVAIFIRPPSLEALRERLMKRGSENMDEINRRYEKSASEMVFASDFDHEVVNDDLDQAIETICELVERQVFVNSA